MCFPLMHKSFNVDIWQLSSITRVASKWKCHYGMTFLLTNTNYSVEQYNSAPAGGMKTENFQVEYSKN